MELASLIATLVLTLGIALWGWHKSNTDKDSDKLKNDLDLRVKMCEVKLELSKDVQHSMQLQIVRLESDAKTTTHAQDKLTEDVEEIRAQMVRKEDLREAMDSLGKRIDDAIRNKQ